MNHNIKKIIEIACVINDITITDLAKKLGCTKQNLFQKVRRNDMRYSDLEEICNQLGIEIKFLKDGKEITY